MVDRYHGSARPYPTKGDALFRELKRDFSAHHDGASRVARVRVKRARRDWIVVAGSAPASVPMWIGRASWLDELETWVQSEAGRNARAAVHVSANMLMRVAGVLADHADHGSGRNCAVTNAVAARVAQCSVRTVRTVRGLLRASELAVEVRRGTGSSCTPTSRRRASVWHLVSRRKAGDNAPICPLPPSRRDRRSTHAGNKSPSTRKRAPRTRSDSNRTRTSARRSAPRPLGVQRLADALVGNEYGRRGLCAGLHRGHIGHICDALTRSGLDLDAWTAPQITAALNADMRQRGWSWPNRIDRPGAFLASRLRRLPQRPPMVRPAHPTAPKPDAEVVVPASAATRAAARAFFQKNRGRGAINH